MVQNRDNRERTIKSEITFSGKGLHTGKVANLRLLPASGGCGIIFIRKDISDDAKLPAIAANVSFTKRSTTLQCGDIQVITSEHLLSALYALKIDNVIIEIDNVEVPILDGSAAPYVEAIEKIGVVTQNKEREYIVIDEEITYSKEGEDWWIKALPYDGFELDVTIDFNSKVLGVQRATFNDDSDYADEISFCKTFCFLHEIEPLLKMGLIKGGDLQNALVIAENELSQEEIENYKKMFNLESLTRSEKGFLSHSELIYDNECARHKLLDLIGDISLVGKQIKGKIIAYKSGHKINTEFAEIIRKKYNYNE